METNDRISLQTAADKLENIAATLSSAAQQIDQTLKYLHITEDNEVHWKANLEMKLLGQLCGMEENLPYCRNLISAMHGEAREGAAALRNRLRQNALGGRAREPLPYQALDAPREVERGEYDR